MSTRLKADLALATCALVWGTTFVLVKNALADASVFAFLAARFILAGIVMAAIFWRSLKRMDAPEIRAGLWLGIFMFGGYAFQTLGLLGTTPSKAAFITGSSVVLVPIFHGIFWRSRIRAVVWVGALAALAGLYFLTVPREGLGQLNRGDLLVGGCAVVFAFHILFVGHYSPKHSVGALGFLQIVVTAVLSLLAMPIASAAHVEPMKFYPTGGLLFAIGLTAVLATALAFSIQIWAQQHTSPSHVAILFSLEPVFAGVASYFLLGERLLPRALAGAALILVGIVVAEMKGPAPAAMESPTDGGNVS
jgi:drug/metabolite transporter (DMT)-like permease